MLTEAELDTLLDLLLAEQKQDMPVDLSGEFEEGARAFHATVVTAMREKRNATKTDA